MADDPKYRSYRSPSARREAAHDDNQRAEDPLVELARLIGQQDPFADPGRAHRSAPAQATPQPQVDADPVPSWLTRPVAADQATNQPQHFYEPEQQAYQAEQQEYWRDVGRNHPDAPGRAGVADQPYVDERYYEAPDPRAVHDAGAPDGRYAAYNPGYAPRPDEEFENYENDEHRATEGERDDEAPPERRRGKLIAAILVVGLAVLGTGATFAYRGLFSGNGAPAQPPVIKADTAPAKITPASQGSDGQISKLIYDRVGERGQDQAEKVVPREERPVDIRDATIPSGPRVAAPSTIPPQTAPAAAAPQWPGPAGQGQPGPTGAVGIASNAAPGSVSDPRRVRTLTIRPDQTGAPPSSATGVPSVPDVAPTRSVTTTAVAPPSGASSSARQAPVRSNGTNPLAITPQSSGTETASLERPPAHATPSRATSAAATESGFFVQLSAQRSNDEAQSSFRSLQAKYPKLLGGRQPVIRRKDLGEKGTFYAAQVGPFDTRDQANEFCGNLKSAGGQCIVQKN
jgi:hypothetical protein